MKPYLQNLQAGAPLNLADAVEGYLPFLLSGLTQKAGSERVVFVARDAEHAALLMQQLEFVDPDLNIIDFPAWDCLPYDRVAANADISARRMAALAELSKGQTKNRSLVLTTVQALTQRVPPREALKMMHFSARIGETLKMDDIIRWLEENGYQRTSTVREAGEYAARGGLIDLFPPGHAEPWRLDFFGDELETIRAFDPETQRTTRDLKSIALLPVTEVVLNAASATHFRQSYAKVFGAPRGDPLYDTVGAQRRYQGMEHWLPLFYDKLDTLFDYINDAPLLFDYQSQHEADERFKIIQDYYEARKRAQDSKLEETPYKPLAPDALYLSPDEWQQQLAAHKTVYLTPFSAPEAEGRTVQISAKAGRNFAAERKLEAQNSYDFLREHISALQSQNKKVVLACWSQGALERLAPVLADHGINNTLLVRDAKAIEALKANVLGLAVLPLEQGFETDDFAIIAEQDVFGERQVRAQNKKRRAQDFISEIATLQPGDIVVHLDHGIGRFVNLTTIEAAGAPHDCLEIHYADDVKLFLPVENIELLSRYGSDDSRIALDKLGGVGWQTRKAKMKQRLRDMAEKLLRIAAERVLRDADKLVAPQAAMDEFRARFPYEETDDQMASIDAVLDDISSGHPMDRLVCGDVGFGKTEVALRAAFAAVSAGKQVAVIVPTTLLARQHTRTFRERFHGLPFKICQASRMVPSKELADVRKGLADGSIDICVGTHALLGKKVEFKDLGLVIVDEEQHFGVAHKERLKQLRSDVHVLTLSATPIPRTLQLALTGVRELSLITTAPVDRLAVRPFVTPFDALVVREALLREHARGGQSFFVCPRIADLHDRKDFLDNNVPEVRVGIAHGQMPPSELDKVMNAFYDRKFDVLLSTSIVESGLDIPTANTLIVHRADLFGLSQLYQLKGRVGRSKLRAYAYFTTEPNKPLNPVAEKRLKVLQSLDTLGAGFQLASHDLDIRGAGNLLGEEQSGHIREVGYELYQQMLQETIAEIQAGAGAALPDQGWSPQIMLGMSVLISEDYVSDLNLRLSLYRRLGNLETEEEIDAFGVELADRFGALPEEADALLKIVSLKILCRKAGVEKIDAGPKGAVIGFRNNAPPNPQALINYMTREEPAAKLRPDQRIVIKRDWPRASDRLRGATQILRRLAAIGTEKSEAA
ncbi:MAG: transcription-repair coupling factor [Pseudomonadota bacterium]